MMRNIFIFSLILVLTAACSRGVEHRQGDVRKQDIGTVAGAIGGAFVGSNVGKGSGRTLGIAMGAILGGIIGSEVGASMDRADRLYMERTSQTTLETAQTGHTSTWVNPDSGNRGTITPQRTYQRNDGQYCREFTQTITIGGNTEDAYGTACRMPDGTWKIQG